MTLDVTTAIVGKSLAQKVADEDRRGLKFTDVQPGPELHRILQIPRREIPDPESDEAVELAAFLTQRFAKRPNPYPGALLPIQALAIKEAWEARGLFGMLRAGVGKTLISYLLWNVFRPQRALYVCPAAMKPDTLKEFRAYARDWHGPTLSQLPILSYEMLSSPSAGEDLDDEGSITKHSLLERMAPQLIIFDESHKLCDSGTTGARRVKAYRHAHPDCVMIFITGTPFKTSIKDGSHLLEWALGLERAPLPTDFLEREMWASYLDAKKGDAPRAGVGALLELLSAEEQRRYYSEEGEDARSVVRQGIARKILEVPGVIGTQDPPLDTRLEIHSWQPEDPDPALDEAFAALRATWSLPDGTELADGLEKARHAATLGYGLWQKWLPPPPVEWRESRNSWAKWCRKALKGNRRGIDSEAKMKAAVRKGLYDDEGALSGWERERDAEIERTGLREPPSVPQWVSDEIVSEVERWLADHNGLVWVDLIGLGETLSARLGIPYYGAKGLDAKGRHITQHPPGTPAIASLAANGTGRNLQRIWFENLWLCTPGEQSLARTHRRGQPSPVVRNWVYFGCFEHHKRFWATRTHKSRFAEDMMMQPQRLRYADMDPADMQLQHRDGARWNADD